MDQSVIIMLVVVAAILIVGFLLWQTQKNRSLKLRSKYGDEYERTVQATGDQKRAERELEQREKRVKDFKLRPLTPDQQRLFDQKWVSIQAFFVDEPSRAVQEANLLIKDVMAARGYPVGDFEQRAADVSVHYPRVVQNYRTAHLIADRNSRGEANTEDLRQALVCYRELFADLLEKPKVENKKYQEVSR
jgi:FtsZ-interacting cell division protein ZipA